MDKLTDLYPLLRCRTARALPTANGAAPLKRGSQAETLHIPNAESTM